MRTFRDHGEAAPMTHLGVLIFFVLDFAPDFRRRLEYGNASDKGKVNEHTGECVIL